MSVAFKAAWMLLKQRGHNLDFTAPEISHPPGMPPRRGTQEEADEMEAMGVPPISRRLGGRTPPNIGRAGSTDIGEESISAMDEGAYPYENLTAFQDYNYRANRNPVTGDLFNPFPKPLAGRVQDQLAEFADGAGRRAAMEPQPDYTGEKFNMNSDDFRYDDEPSRIEESHPEAHNIASTTLRQTPRKQKRGMMDSGEAFDRPGFRGPAMPLPGGKKDGDFQNMPPQVRGYKRQ